MNLSATDRDKARKASRVSAAALSRLAESAELTALTGCGPKIADCFIERGIRTVGDLVRLVPRRYDDMRAVESIGQLTARVESGELQGGEFVIVRGVVARARIVPAGRRFMEVLLTADGAATSDERVLCRWFFARPGQLAQFAAGRRVILAGAVRIGRKEPDFANPEIVAWDEAADSPAPEIRPRYGDIPGVGPNALRKLILQAVQRVEHLSSAVPEAVWKTGALPSLDDAIRTVHLPSIECTPDELAKLSEQNSPAHERLVWEEVFPLQVALARRRAAYQANRTQDGAAIPTDRWSDVATQVFPFELTAAQRRVIGEVAADFARGLPMQRLLQGDVGSGKTAVALLAAHLTIASGRQVAMMAPTELLAEQHHRTLSAWGKKLGYRVALLSASLPAPVRASTLALIGAGAVPFVVGTHALFADRVAFSDLGLAIIDEQHRFGVAQRARLRDKGGAQSPHLLVMTATPIPRTLALAVYGDLDTSVLDELPPGRQPISTHVLGGPTGRSRAEKLIEREISAGGQAFVVCSKISADLEESDDADIEMDGAAPKRADAESTFAHLRERFGDVVGLVHGRIPSIERESTMAAFAAGRLKILVATTVIEVGVDVPRANVMVIEDADRFGIAQLHQLRGRVGRGSAKSYCVLLTSVGRSSDAGQRLTAVAGNSDGFALAEIDLALRGPGELFGRAQAGRPRLLFGDLEQHLLLLGRARDAARALIERDPTLGWLEHGILRRRIAELEALQAAGTSEAHGAS